MKALSNAADSASFYTFKDGMLTIQPGFKGIIQLSGVSRIFVYGGERIILNHAYATSYLDIMDGTDRFNMNATVTYMSADQSSDGVEFLRVEHITTADHEHLPPPRCVEHNFDRPIDIMINGEAIVLSTELDASEAS